jgi:hypothetical protein
MVEEMGQNQKPVCVCTSCDALCMYMLMYRNVCMYGMDGWMDVWVDTDENMGVTGFSCAMTIGIHTCIRMYVSFCGLQYIYMYTYVLA